MKKIIIVIIMVVFLGLCGCSSSDKTAPSPNATATSAAPSPNATVTPPAPSPNATATSAAPSPNATVTPPAPSPDATLSTSASKSDVKETLVKNCKENGAYGFIARTDLVDVLDIEIGPVLIRKSCSMVFNEYRCVELPIQSFEAKLKYNCVDKRTNKTLKSGQENISGEISRDKMGRFQISGNSYFITGGSMCLEYQYGCAMGDCQNGLGLYFDKEGNDSFLGRFKNVGNETIIVYAFKSWCGAVGECSHKFTDKRATLVYFAHDMNRAPDQFTAAKELFEAKLLNKTEYQELLAIIEKNAREQEKEREKERERNRPSAK